MYGCPQFSAAHALPLPGQCCSCTHYSSSCDRLQTCMYVQFVCMASCASYEFRAREPHPIQHRQRAKLCTSPSQHSPLGGGRFARGPWPRTRTHAADIAQMAGLNGIQPARMQLRSPHVSRIQCNSGLRFSVAQTCMQHTGARLPQESLHARPQQTVMQLRDPDPQPAHRPARPAQTR